MDVEKEASRSPSGTSEDRGSSSGTAMEPIRTAPSQSPSQRPASRAGSRAGSRLARERSHNGYGVSAEEKDRDEARGDADEFEVAWDGGDSDPECPRSFGVARKWLIVVIISMGAFCVTAASSIYTSTYAQIEAEFGNAHEVSVLGLSTFVLGIAFGPMFLSPFSEFYGRRPIYLVSWLLYVVWFIPSARARNIETLIVTRFLGGFSGSAFLAVAGGTVGDLFSKTDLQTPMAVFTLAPFIGPTLGPLLGGFIDHNVHWRWTWYVMLAWSGLLYAAIVLLVPETFHPVLLRGRARRRRRATGDGRWHAAGEAHDRSIARALGDSLRRPFQLLAREYMVLLLCLYSGLLLAILYLFFGAFPLIFGAQHGFNLWQTGLTFLGIGAGMVLAMGLDPVWARVRDRLAARLRAETGVEGGSEPEFRLPPAILGSVFLPVGLFWFGWTTYPSVHWIVPIMGSAVFGAGTILAFIGILTFLVDAYPEFAASAIAANAFVRCTMAAAFPLFGNQMYERLGYQWASSLLGFLTLAMMPFPYLFFRYGRAIRARSSFAKSS